MSRTAPPPTDAPLMLSVSGMRGIVGKTLTPVVAAEYAAACGSFFREQSGRDNPIVCLGRDSRPSGEMLSAAAGAGLAAVGCRVIDLGIVMTPTAGVMIDQHRAAGGLIITASHNPGEWNGIKCLDSDGVAPPPEQIELVLKRFHGKQFEYLPAEAIPPTSRDDRATQEHVERVLRSIDPEPIQKKKFKVVLDSVNGAGGAAGRMLLEALGCELVHLYAEPTGQFAHTPEPTEENLTELAERTAVERAACGFAQDPDADRLAIVDENGRYIGEEYTLVLSAWQMLEEGGPCPMAANLSTSRMIDDLAERYPGASVHRAAVGEANVAQAMKQHNAIIGGEGNGGVIRPEITWVRDSLSAMALVLGLLASKNRSVSSLIGELPRYAMIKRKLDLARVGGRDAVGPILARVADAFSDQNCNTTDGVRIDWPDRWAHLRPSNTEPIVRLIVEAPDEAAAAELADKVAAAAGIE